MKLSNSFAGIMAFHDLAQIQPIEDYTFPNPNKNVFTFRPRYGKNEEYKARKPFTTSPGVPVHETTKAYVDAAVRGSSLDVIEGFEDSSIRGWNLI